MGSLFYRGAYRFNCINIVRGCKIEENQKETKEQGSTDTGEGDKPKEPSVIEQTNEAAERLERANEEAKRLIAEKKAKDAIAGIAEAGMKDVVKEEETNQEYVDRMRKNGWKADETK